MLCNGIQIVNPAFCIGRDHSIANGRERDLGLFFFSVKIPVGFFQLFDQVVVVDGGSDLAGQQGQQIEIMLVEIAPTNFVDAGNSTQKIVAPDQRDKNDVADFLFPLVAFFFAEFVEDALPPGAAVFPDPAADPQIDIQAFPNDLIGVDPVAGAVGILVAVRIKYGNKHGFSLNQALGKGGHQLKNAFKVEPFTHCGDDFLEQGYLLIAQE